MNNVSKLYEVYINKELQTVPNSVLNPKRLNQKILSFLHDLSDVSLDSRCFLFWEKPDKINHDQLLEHYLEGLSMLMSIGYELKIDSIKNYTEIPEDIEIENLFFKIYHSILNVQKTLSSQEYQNTIEDYFTLGFKLGIKTEEILKHY